MTTTATATHHCVAAAGTGPQARACEIAETLAAARSSAQQTRGRRR